MTPTMAPGLRATVSAVCRAEDLTAAIKAVIPHTGKEKDGGGVERVRVVADVERMRLALVATNRQRAAVALVPLLEVDEPTELDAETDTTEGLDFTAPALKVITQVFKSTGTERLRLDITAQTLQATDVDGLLEGRTIRLRAQGEYFDEGGLDRVDGVAGSRGARRRHPEGDVGQSDEQEHESTGHIRGWETLAPGAGEGGREFHVFHGRKPRCCTPPPPGLFSGFVPLPPEGVRKALPLLPEDQGPSS